VRAERAEARAGGRSGWLRGLWGGEPYCSSGFTVLIVNRPVD